MKCSHCHLEYQESSLKKVVDSNEELYFCCSGCESVYFLLKENNLSSFYDRLGSKTLLPPSIKDENLSYLDSSSFLEANTTKVDDLYEVNLIINGIHCAACVWLNENALGLQKGIKKVLINYTNNKAKILFNPNEIKLSKIFELIASLGYKAQIYDPKLQETKILKENRSFFISFVVGVFCTMNIMWIAVAQYAGYFSSMDQNMKDVLNLVSCLLATPVLFYTGRVFYKGAFYGLKNGYIGMDFLVAFGASLTFIYSLYAAITRSGETYFESVAMIILFVFSGKFLEARAKLNANDSLDSLHSLLPSTLSLESNEGVIQKEVKEVKENEIVIARSGEMLALDGVALESCVLDLSSINGESIPVRIEAGQEVLSGSFVLDSSFKYKVSKTYTNSFMNGIINLLEDSLNHRPRIQNFANSMSKHFSRVVLFIALCGFIAWFYATSDIQYSLMIAICVIVISCPCALALATPIASVVGINRAYKKKILFKEAKFLETLSKAKVVFLDKTGTITKGELKVSSVKEYTKLESSLLKSLVANSTHPISKAVFNYLESSLDSSIKQVNEIKARGLKADSRLGALIGGSIEFLKENGVLLDSSVEKELEQNADKSVFLFALDSKLQAIFYLQDELKEDALSFVTYLKENKKEVVLLSGDGYSVVKSVAESLGINKFYAEAMPEFKANIVREAKNESVMVGDGLNDILALQNASVGISLGSGSRVAINTSSVVILDDSLSGLEEAFKIADSTYKRILENIKISIIYNALMIPLALSGFVIPLVAALSMSLSSLLVVANSKRKF